MDYYNYAGNKIWFTSPTEDKTSYEKWWDKRELFTVQAYLDYLKTFSEDHNFKAMLGVQYSYTDYESNTNTAEDIIPSLEIVNGQRLHNITANKW